MDRTKPEITLREVPKYWDGNCFGCSQTNPIGLRLRFWISEDGCLTRCTISDEMSGFTGITHGGIISTLIDEVCGWTIITHMGGRLGFTSEMAVRYIKPVPTNAEIIVKGRIIEENGKYVRVSASIKSSDDVLLAEGECKYVIPSPAALAKLGNIDTADLQEFMDAYK